MSGSRASDPRVAEASSGPRRRAEWMVDRIHGDRVLDVGCGQGVASILAARGGRSVVGLDRDASAIERAQRDRAAEPPDVQARLRFVVADIHDPELDGDRFDTVLLGEIIDRKSVV